MNLKTLFGLSLCTFATATGCVAEPDAAPESQSLEEALSNLPDDIQARAAALDELFTRFEGDARLMDAQRELEADATPGLLRRVERQDGRFVSFVAIDGGGVVIEGGPRSLPPLTAELGLADAAPAALWRALLPNEPAPSSLEGTWDEDHVFAQAAGGEGTWPGSPFVPAANESNAGVGTARQGLTEDQFLVAGGCAIQPTPSGAVFRDQVPSSPYCGPSSSGDGAVALRSAEVRVRLNVFSGALVNLKISRDGSAVAFVGVQRDYWANQRHFNNDHKVTRCSGIFSRTCRITWEPTPSLWRVDLQNATGDGYHLGALWFNEIDSRADAQPW